MSEVDRHPIEARSPQRRHGDLEHFEVGCWTGGAIQFGPDLQGLAHRERVLWPRVQDTARVAEPGDTRAIQDVRVDARDLRRRISAQSEHAAARLVHEFEGAQIEITARAGEERIDVFDQRRNYQLVAIACIKVQQGAARGFEPPRFTRQHIGNILWEQPARHRKKGNSA